MESLDKRVLKGLAETLSSVYAGVYPTAPLDITEAHGQVLANYIDILIDAKIQEASK